MQLPQTKIGVWALALLTVALFAGTTIAGTRHPYPTPFGDFAYLQTGAQCLVSGCNPYDFAALNQEAVARHEAKPPIWPMSPVYPPSALLLMLPFTGIPWPAAAYVFNGFAGGLCALGCVWMIRQYRICLWHPPVLILVALLLSRPMTAVLEFANPALLTSGLLILACLLLLRQAASGPGWCLLGLALALKPQLALGPVVVLLLRPATRPSVVKSCALTIALLLAGALAYRLRLGSFGYFANLRFALWLSSLPGASADFATLESYDFLNLQTIIAILPVPSRAAANAIAWIVTCLLVTSSAWLQRRRNTQHQHPWTLIALAVGISVLPVYHRGYDRVVGLLFLPAAMELYAHNRRLGWLFAALVACWAANDTVMTHILRRFHYMPQNGLEDVAFCLVLLYSLWHRTPSSSDPVLHPGPLVAS
jgi:hypothetical protein